MEKIQIERMAWETMKKMKQYAIRNWRDGYTFDKTFGIPNKKIPNAKLGK